MKKATYLRCNILEQHEEVTNGENMHGVALGTNEVSSHLFFSQTHKCVNTYNHHSRILLYPAVAIFTGL